MEWEEIRKATRVRCVEGLSIPSYEDEGKKVVAFIKGKEYPARIGLFRPFPNQTPKRALYVPKNEAGYRHFIAVEGDNNEYFSRHFEIVRRGRK